MNNQHPRILGGKRRLRFYDEQFGFFGGDGECMYVRESENEDLQAGYSIGEASGFWHLLIDEGITWFQFLAQEQLCSSSFHAVEWLCPALGWPGACGSIGCLRLA